MPSHKEQTARMGSWTVSSTATPSIPTNGCPFIAIECLTSSSLAVKIKGDFGSGTSRMLRYYLLSSTSTETSVDPDTASGTLAAQDVILVPTMGAQNIEIVRTAGSGTVSSCAYATDALTPFLVQKLIDSGIAVTTTPPAIQCSTYLNDGTDEILVDATARKFWGWSGSSIDDVPAWIKFYDTATAASESDTPFLRDAIPCNSTAANGAGRVAGPWPAYVALTNGLSFRAVAGIGNADDTGLTTTTHIINVFWSV